MLFLNIVVMAVSLVMGQSTIQLRDDCEPLTPSGKMPALNSLADSVSLQTKLVALNIPAGADVIVSVRSGSPARAFFGGVESPTTLQEDIRTAVLETLRLSTKKSPDAFRIHVVVGTSIVLTAESSMLCAPTEIEGTSSRAPIVMRMVAPANGPTPRGPRSVTPVIQINAAGKVTNVDLGSGSGNWELDKSISDGVMLKQYRPALLDGEPVDVRLRGKRVELVR